MVLSSVVAERADKNREERVRDMIPPGEIDVGGNIPLDRGKSKQELTGFRYHEGCWLVTIWPFFYSECKPKEQRAKMEPAKMVQRTITFEATKSSGKVRALLLVPENARCLYVFAHGAGAGMEHPFMEHASRKLAEKGIGTFRYQFPYMEQKSKRPDPKPILFATVRSAVERAHREMPDIPLFAGGKSMGGRMTSNAASESPLDGVRGIVFFGFPLHPPGAPSIERAEHLYNVSVPMLFLQGTRDSLADLTLLKPVCEKLGDRATLHIVVGADHSFHMLKSAGRSDGEVLEELGGVVAKWTSETCEV